MPADAWVEVAGYGGVGVAVSLRCCSAQLRLGPNIFGSVFADATRGVPPGGCHDAVDLSPDLFARLWHPDLYWANQIATGRAQPETRYAPAATLASDGTLEFVVKRRRYYFFTNVFAPVTAFVVIAGAPSSWTATRRRASACALSLLIMISQIQYA
ncbi:hypothetical protein SO694_00012493 [Aureococcus anophagefferens]|uniref:Neurotransmitter-gated ion-channel ligand-binding domain-containing protein n=1 Tax=Aureococcus anophagefferens TaxID=44056 RepID=A0ABR1G1A5_AURAN